MLSYDRRRFETISSLSFVLIFSFPLHTFTVTEPICHQSVEFFNIVLMNTFPFDAKSLPERFLIARPLVTRFAITRDRIAVTELRGVYDGQDVAVKLLDWGEERHSSEAEIVSLKADFAQEVAVWHKLDHPNVTKFIGATMGASCLQLPTKSGPLAMPNSICCVVVE
ncbi:Protein kinase-like domain protein [Raphanus sativus]|nr:Protein kinase-like domain protein [Raphanus sativus]